MTFERIGRTIGVPRPRSIQCMGIVITFILIVMVKFSVLILAAEMADCGRSTYLFYPSLWPAPIMPPQSMLLKEINVTTATLDITSWLTSGCPIRFFSVRYRLWGDMDWHLVNNNIPSNIVRSSVGSSLLLARSCRSYSFFVFSSLVQSCHCMS